ncbi:DUF1653 domain-containing protein [Candidatus Parcubacteria bacterium]|jgi:hypothetical protein|nr:DUF1653 domain-containing protein [Candidatus Parcubacteria bacterium]MBT3949070.1 DUF1653 domain-containing protein [Candidatus Parcubacteria bacterium]
MNIKPGIYHHYKGNEYRLHCVGKHSETLEKFVIYETLYNNPKSKFWVRPIEMFEDKVEWEGKIVPRFKFVKD